MGFGKFMRAVGKALSAQPTSSGAPSSSGLLGFQETGTLPKVDSHGRVIVKIKGGSPGPSWGVNLSHLDFKLANKIAGKVNEDEDFAKTIRVRLRPDVASQYANSVLVEFPDGQFIGWVLKDASEEVASVLDQIKNGVESVVAELRNRELTYEFSARVEGQWDEVGEGDGAEEWEANIEFMEIRMKNPAEIEID